MSDNFDSWMKQVDRHLVSVCGLGHRDLADWRYRDAFDDGVHPREAAFDVLEYNDMPSDLLDAVGERWGMY